MLFLTRDELATLTGKKRKSSQIEALKQMSIPHLVNPAGEPVVESRYFSAPEPNARPLPGWEPRAMAPAARHFRRQEQGRPYGA